MSDSLAVASPRRTVWFGGAGALALVAVAALVLLRSHATPAGDTVTGAPVATAQTTPALGAEVDILLGLARDATRENRLVAPQGNNAYEYYLSVIQIDANNATAHEALRETLPFASQEIEGQINRRELEEARREIGLLRDYDPTNYTLIILGAKLDAQQRVVTAQDEAKADAMRRRNG